MQHILNADIVKVMFEIIIQYGDTSASQGNQFQHLNILLKIVFICLNVISYILTPSSLA